MGLTCDPMFSEYSVHMRTHDHAVTPALYTSVYAEIHINLHNKCNASEALLS